MDEHKEKEEDKFHESAEQQRPRKQEAEEEDTSVDEHLQEGYKEGTTFAPEPEEVKEPTAVVQLKEVVETGPEEETSAPQPSLFFGIFAHPCSLLQYLLRACAGWWCWGPLHHSFGDDPKKPQAAAVAPPEAVAPANSTTEQGNGGGENASAGNYFYMQEVVTRVWAVRRARPPPGAPGRPREGRGGNGGIHN